MTDTLNSHFREKRGFRFIEAGAPSAERPVICLHGILGTADEWRPVVRRLAAQGHHVYVPAIPFQEFPLRSMTVIGVMEYVRSFVEALRLDPAVLVGNSLGGQVALCYVLEYPDSVIGLGLAGAAGMYEVPLGTSLIRRGDREYLRKSAAVAFFDPAHADDALVERLYDTANDRRHAIRILALARDSARRVIQERLGEITAPTMLIWGREDRITPADVAESFADAIANAELHFISNCGHAPMIEWPDVFSDHLTRFLRQVVYNGVAHAV